MRRVAQLLCEDDDMTIVEEMTFQAGDRLRKVMQVRGIGVGELADELEVARNTITNLTTGRSPMDKRSALALSVVLDVPYEWLRFGVNDEAAPVETGAAISRARRDSNPQPSDP
ncbi:helix-turn-helix domain-containing protein [Agromyces larvae]|uniref:helix-turn-helix domain-containing protein n=1 Tax=Agromyces larvae TaxID=2929802 RepID=UPI00338E0156